MSETIYTFKNVLHIDFLYLPTRKSFPTQYLLREQERRQKIVESWEAGSCELKHKYFVCLTILYFYCHSACFHNFTIQNIRLTRSSLRSTFNRELRTLSRLFSRFQLPLYDFNRILMMDFIPIKDFSTLQQ